MEVIASFIHDCQLSKAKELLENDGIESTSRPFLEEGTVITYLGIIRSGQYMKYSLLVAKSDVLRAREIINANIAMINELRPAKRPEAVMDIIFISILGVGALAFYLLARNH